MLRADEVKREKEERLGITCNLVEQNKSTTQPTFKSLVIPRHQDQGLPKQNDLGSEI